MKVSLCSIAYNEARALPQLFEAIISQDYPHDQIQIILVDGRSNDQSKSLMEGFKAYATDFDSVKVIDNPKRIQAAGWNEAILAADGDVIIRVDSHATIPSDFVRKNVEVLESGEAVSGGPRPNIVDEPTPWKETLFLAESSMFGSSIAAYRRDGEKSYVNSVFHGAYRREVFENVGGFNEALGRTEDNELHYRIRKAGYKICFDPEIHSYQHTRGSLKGMLKQKYGNGYWIGLTSGVCPKCLSIYHFVPFAFVCGIIGTSILAACKRSRLAKLMWTAYGAVSVGMSLLAVKNVKKHIDQIVLPGLFCMLHISYGVGTLVGLVKMPFWKRNYHGDESVQHVKQLLNKKREVCP